MKDIEKMDNKVFYSQLKKIAVPIALLTFMTAAISAGDSAMLGFINQDSIAAVSLATRVSCVCAGIYFLSRSFDAEYGKNQKWAQMVRLLPQ